MEIGKPVPVKPTLPCISVKYRNMNFVSTLFWPFLTSTFSRNKNFFRKAETFWVFHQRVMRGTSWKRCFDPFEVPFQPKSISLDKLEVMCFSATLGHRNFVPTLFWSCLTSTVSRSKKKFQKPETFWVFHQRVMTGTSWKRCFDPFEVPFQPKSKLVEKLEVACFSATGRHRNFVPTRPDYESKYPNKSTETRADVVIYWKFIAVHDTFMNVNIRKKSDC